MEERRRTILDLIESVNSAVVEEEDTTMNSDAGVALLDDSPHYRLHETSSLRTVRAAQKHIVAIERRALHLAKHLAVAGEGASTPQERGCTPWWRSAGRRWR